MFAKLSNSLNSGKMSYAAASRRHERQHHHHAQQQRVHYEAAPVTRRSTDGPTEVHIEGVVSARRVRSHIWLDHLTLTPHAGSSKNHQTLP